MLRLHFVLRLLHQNTNGCVCTVCASHLCTRCLVNAINAREFCKRLEADLAAGRNEQECRGMVKVVLRGLTLQESIKDAVLYLPRGKRQVPFCLFLRHAGEVSLSLVTLLLLFPKHAQPPPPGFDA